MAFLAPLIAPIIAFAATPLGGIIVNLALTAGATLLRAALNNMSPDQEQSAPGFKLTTSFGDNGPLAFLIGKSGTAGTRRYINSYGVSGGTPRAYLVIVDQISNLSIAGNQDIIPWINGSSCTVVWTDPVTDKGYPISEFRDENGKDHAWMRVRTGDETTVDAHLSARFGSHATRPWQTTAIGTNAPSVITTFLINRDYFRGEPKMFYEVAPTKFYDFRLDSTNGGSGTARWNDLTTYTATYNQVVIAYNIARGIYRDSRWLFGGRNAPAHRFNISTWIAAANACDTNITTSVGTEATYRCGGEINCSAEPFSILNELMTSCNGRISFTGTQFEIYVGSPSASTYSFTDDDVLISRPQGFKEFEGFQEIFNAVQASSPNPVEMFAMKPLPLRKNTQFATDDGGLVLASGINLRLVPFRRQAQRLTLALLNDGRRVRVHSMFFHPAMAWQFTAGQIIDWTSTTNGYVSKDFQIHSIHGEAGMMQEVVIREVDPTDYNFSISDEITEINGDLSVDYVEAQLMTGWSAAATTIIDENGNAIKASIIVLYTGQLPDIKEIAVEVRKLGETVLAFTGTVPYDINLLTPSSILPAIFAGLTNYELRGKFIPFSGRITRWSNQDINGVDGAWSSIITDDVRVYINDLSDSFQDYQTFMGEGLYDYLEFLNSLGDATSDEIWSKYADKQDILTEITSSAGLITAAYTSQVTAATGPTSAIVLRLDQFDIDISLKAAITVTDAISVRLDDGTTGLIASADAVTALEGTVGYASGASTWRMQTAYTPSSGWTSKIGLQTRASSGDLYKDSGIYLEATSTLSRILMDADQIVIKAGATIAALFQSGTTYINNANIVNLTATNISVKSIDANAILIDGTLVENLIAAGAIAFGGSSNYARVALNRDGTERTLLSESLTVKTGPFLLMLDGLLHTYVSGSSNWGTYRFNYKINGTTIKTHDLHYDENGQTQTQDGLLNFRYYVSSTSTPLVVSVTYQNITGSIGYNASVEALGFSWWSSLT